jgi:hypothetical protein
MGQQKEQVRDILANMVKMGWHVKENANGTSAQVGAPGKPTVTVPIRGSGYGTGLDNAMREIRKTGYSEAWPAFVAKRATDRKATNAEAVPTPAQVFAPVEPAAEAAPRVPATRLVGTERDVIDGHQVTDRVSAKGRNPVGGGEMPVSGVDEVMLDDGRVVYQCVRSEFCFDAFAAVASAVSHLRTHGRPQAAARKDRALAAEERSREQKSQAGIRAHEVRRMRQALLLRDESRAEWLLGLADELEQAIPILRELTRVKVDVPEPVTEEELAELRAKAAKWDTFLNMTRS